MSILCLTGWQQRVNELSSVTPPDAQHFNYMSYTDVVSVFSDLPKQPKIAIGWSLGGQLLMRAVAGGYTRPEVLLLLGAPYQYVADTNFPHGIHMEGFKEFSGNYESDAAATLKQFNALTGLGDNRVMRIIRALNHDSEIFSNGLYWLNELASYSFHGMDFSGFPKTIIVHGKNDKVVDTANALELAKHIPQSEMLLWQDCGHAPHLHDPDALRVLINNYV